MKEEGFLGFPIGISRFAFNLYNNDQHSLHSTHSNFLPSSLNLNCQSFSLIFVISMIVVSLICFKESRWVGGKKRAFWRCRVRTVVDLSVGGMWSVAEPGF